MSAELHWLLLTVVLTALLPFPYVIDRILLRGLMGAMQNPSPDDPPLHAWAERAKRAHANAVENMVIFVPAALAVHALGVGNAATGQACALFFWARLAHYAVYCAGIPVARTAAYFIGWASTAFLVVRALGIA